MSCLMEHKERTSRKEEQQEQRKDIKPGLTAQREIGRARAVQEALGCNSSSSFACFTASLFQPLLLLMELMLGLYLFSGHCG